MCGKPIIYNNVAPWIGETTESEKKPPIISSTSAATAPGT